MLSRALVSGSRLVMTASPNAAKDAARSDSSNSGRGSGRGFSPRSCKQSVLDITSVAVPVLVHAALPYKEKRKAGKGAEGAKGVELLRSQGDQDLQPDG